MPASKSGLAALLLAAWLLAPGSVRAQAPASRSVPGGATGSYPAGQAGSSLSQFYGMTPNFANYGLSGTYPNQGGYGYAGYGPGAQFGAHYPASTAPVARPKPARAAADRKPAAGPGGPWDASPRGRMAPRKGL